MPIAALSHAGVVGGVCLVIGAVVLFAGAYLGIFDAPAKAAAENKAKLEEAKTKIEELTAQLKEARAARQGVATEAEDAHLATAEGVESALKQVGDIVASLPEYQRFPGLLVLLGVVLMGVAVIQFGGTSIF